MNKKEFITSLKDGIQGLPNDEAEERLSFYSEMIDDLVEEGFSEEEAIFKIGDVDDIIAQSINDIPLTKVLKEKIKPKRRLTTFEIILLVLGSPIWLSLLVAAFAVVLSLYVTLWSVIISMWAVQISTVGVAVAGMISGTVFVCIGNAYAGIAMIGLSIACIGLSIFLFYGCKTATMATVIFTKKVITSIKQCLIKKEGEQ